MITRRLAISSFIGRVLDDDIGFIVLEITKRQQYNVSLVDPDLGKLWLEGPGKSRLKTCACLFSHFASDVR